MKYSNKMKFKVDNTQAKLRCILNKGFSVNITNTQDGVELRLSKNGVYFTSENDIDLFNVIDKTYKVMSGGGYD